MESRRPARKQKNLRRPVSEANGIQITERLRAFRESGLQELTFERSLSNSDRAAVHSFARKMGFTTKSRGKGDQRCVTVYKSGIQKKDPGPAATPAPPISFSQETQQALLEVFSKFPPTEDEASTGMEHSAVFSSVPQKPEKVQSMHMTPVEIERELELYASRLQSSPALKRIEQTRQKLPIAPHKAAIASAVDQNQVVIIAGETGCGKSTQVPQYLLDHMWTQRKPCRIVCTQPRRISATAVADRVASERGEDIGKTVGYQIRLEGKGGLHSSLMFCTNGVLLRKLVASDVQATHIIVDEIHERDCNADFLLIILRDLLPAHPNLRVVLMSATLNAEVFSMYFNNCPILRIPGFIHPVQVYYLEDVLALINPRKNVNQVKQQVKEVETVVEEEDQEEMDAALVHASDDDFDYLMGLMTANPTAEFLDFQHSETGVTALMAAAAKGRAEDVTSLLTLGASCDLESRDGKTALLWAESNHQARVAELLKDHIQQREQRKKAELAVSPDEMLEKYREKVDPENLDFPLMEKLLRVICSGPDASGAVLIFLPGWEDIVLFRNRLLSSKVFGDPRSFLVVPLHSMIPMNEQKKVFVTPPAGVRKIVLSTNIAETSITINDVVYVIDTGKMKEKSYDPYTNVSTLQQTWVSKANARQRQGRAGRVRPGVCYHMFSRFRAASLEDYQLPEMNRTPLEEVCLKVKLMQPSGSIREFLANALDPPLDITIRNAISLLQDIGALTLREELTHLGKELGSLPVHPATSKMLLLGILLNCLDPALTIACAAGYREPYVLPMSHFEKKKALDAKAKFEWAYGGYSDHLATVAVFELWEKSRRKEAFCRENYLNANVLHMLDGMRKQLLRELVAKGFVGRDTQRYSLNARDPGILRALVTASLYPAVGRLLSPVYDGQKGFVQVARGEKVRINNSSVNSRLTNTHRAGAGGDKHLLVFDEITRGDARAYIRNSTLIKPHPLLFLCTELSVAPLEYHSSSDDDDDNDGGGGGGDGGEVEMMDGDGVAAAAGKKAQLMETPDSSIALVIDRWLKYQTTSVEAAQIYCLRERLLGALYHKVRHPRDCLPEMLGASVYALACILSYEGALDMDRTGGNGSSFREQEQMLRRSFDSLGMRRREERSTFSSNTYYNSRAATRNSEQQPENDGRNAGFVQESAASRARLVEQRSSSTKAYAQEESRSTRNSSVQIRQTRSGWKAGSSSSSKQEWRVLE